MQQFAQSIEISHFRQVIFNFGIPIVVPFYAQQLDEHFGTSYDHKAKKRINHVSHFF